MKVKRKGVLAALLATVAALGVGVSLAGTASAAGKTVTIGWAYDSKGNMSPFDDPALAAAQAARQAGQRPWRRAAQDHHLRHAEQQSRPRPSRVR